MVRRRRSVEVFSLSFLDCICCGFGAIILLLVLTQYGDPLQLEERTRMRKAQVMQLEDQVHEIRGETELLNRQLQGKEDLLAQERMRAAKLAGDLTRINGQFAASKKEASVTNIVQGELVSAYQVHEYPARGADALDLRGEQRHVRRHHPRLRAEKTHRRIGAPAEAPAA